MARKTTKAAPVTKSATVTKSAASMVPTRARAEKAHGDNANGSEGMVELGATGLRRTGGLVDEEFLPELKGEKAVRAFKEMRDNDATVGAILFIIEMLVRNVKWHVNPFSKDAEDQQRATFLETCLDDMSASWEDTVAEFLSFLTFGWSFHEIVYKRRLGPDQTDPTKRSRYTDGRIGWRKMPIRSQDSLDRWVFDESGGVQAMVQRDPETSQDLTIPIEKALLFRTTIHKGSPEGKSVLRNAYRPWSAKKRIENIEAIGVERDLAGMPLAYVPPRILSPNATPDEKRTAAEIRKIVTQVRRDESEGVIFPMSYDEKGNQLYEFKLLASSGTRQFNTTDIRNGYKQEIATTVLADIILMGQQAVGSYALADTKTEIFAAAIGAWLKSIAGVMNRHAVPRLFRLNGWKVDRLPELAPGDVESRDLVMLSTFISNLVNAGVLTPTTELENFLLEQANLPVPEMDQEADDGLGDGLGGNQNPGAPGGASVFDTPGGSVFDPPAGGTE